MSVNKMLEMEIRAAYIFLIEKNHTIPSDTLQFMLDASLEKLNSVEYNEVLDIVSHCGLTEGEQEERNDLMALRAEPTRFFYQSELDRLEEINDKMFKNSKNPHCG